MKLKTGFGLELPLYNANILINGGFQIWQRGDEFVKYNGIYSGYCADRYYCSIPNGSKIIKNTINGGLEIQKNTSTSALFIRQYIETNVAMINYLTNKNLNLSFKCISSVDMTITIGIGIQRKTVNLFVGENIISTNFLVTKNDFNVSEKYLDVVIFNNIDARCNVVYEYCKIEVNNFATPFIMNSYEIDLNNCLRYYQTANNYAGNAIPYSSTILYVVLPYIHQMRANPSIIVTNNSEELSRGLYSLYEGFYKPIINIVSAVKGSQFCSMTITSSGLDVTKRYIVRNAVVSAIDAEIYP